MLLFGLYLIEKKLQIGQRDSTIDNLNTALLANMSFLIQNVSLFIDLNNVS